MRKKIVAGNWKMNLTWDEVKAFVSQWESKASELNNVKCEVLIAPPFPYIQALAQSNSFVTGAQNCHEELSGAFTGEVSVAMIKSLGGKFVIIGHSERRKYFAEDEKILEKKVKQVLANGLTVVFCVGESLEERQANKTLEVVKQQIIGSLSGFSSDDLKNIVIAYEPVWAIGTGLSATPQQAQEVHKNIREILSSHWDEKVAEQTSILYGGSCKPDNANDLFSQPDIDGGLIGGAALKVEDFSSLVSFFK